MKDLPDGTWSRVCPQCHTETIHKNRAKCHGAERLNKPCIKCSRKNNGRSQALTDTCPVCNETIRVTVTKPQDVVDHAATHNLTAEALWDIKTGIERPKCKCGCGKYTTFVRWGVGYQEFLIGHNASIYSGIYTPEEEERLAQTRGTNWRGKPSWCKGLTKETDERVAARGKKTSKGRKEAFDAGEISIWSKGLTKKTDERVAAFAEQIKQEFADGKRVAWQKGLTEETDERVKQKNDDLRQKYQTGELVTWHKGKTKQDDPRIAKTWEKRDPLSEYENIRWSHDEIKLELEKNTNLVLEKITDYRRDRAPSLWMRCRTCNWQELVSFLFARNDRCPKCHPTGSNGQHEIADFIESLNFKVGRNVRGLIGRQELDVFIPEKMLAIEFNGLYWHNEAAGKDRYYHGDKSSACKKLGIDLFHVFEDEWYNKQPIVADAIKKRLGLTMTVDAKDCLVKRLTNIEADDFFIRSTVTHQPGSVSVGLTKDGSIISAAAIISDKQTAKIMAWADALGTTVMGSTMTLAHEASKISGCVRASATIDPRLGHSLSYSDCGWTLAHTGDEMCWFTDGQTRQLTESTFKDPEQVSPIWGLRALTFVTRF